MSPRTAGYMVRKTLPPWKAQETIEELVRLMPQYQVEEVIFKIDTEEFSHGLPTVEMIEPFIPWLNEAREKLAAVGVKMSINPWVTLVHNSRGRDCRPLHPGMRYMVGHDGSQGKVTPCPLCPKWRELMAKLYGMYASAKPEVLWVEDDIRTFNHEPVRWGCFCPLHLAEFQKRYAEHRTREQLVANILAPGEPHPDRKRWFDLLGETMVDVAAVFEQATHAASPTTKLGLMTSGPNEHAMEGRRWQDFCRALAGPTPLVVRPSLGNYREDNARGLYYAGQNYRKTMACLPRPVIVEPEMESMPFTLYSKSAAFTRLQNALCYVLGADGVTMNMYDHLGSPIENWPQYGKMLAASKPFMNAIADRCLPDGQIRGVQLLHHPRGADVTRLPPKADYPQLRSQDEGWALPIESLGMTTTYQESPVRAVTGQLLRAYSRAHVELFLSQGLLLDLSAAETLLSMGHGPMIGVEKIQRFNKRTRPLSAEEHVDKEIGGTGSYSTLTGLTHSQEMAEMTLLPEARVISRFVDPDRKPVMPGMHLFQNRLGGRVAVYPFDFSHGIDVPFLNDFRQQQLSGVVWWLGQGTMPLYVTGGVYPLALRVDYPQYTVVAVANLSMDPWPRLLLSLARGKQLFRKIERVNAHGQWQPVKPRLRQRTGGQLDLVIDDRIAPAEMAVYTLWA